MTSAAKAAMLPASHQRRPARIAVLPCRSPRCDPATCSTRQAEILRREVRNVRLRGVLLGVLRGAGLADDRDADLAGVGQLFFDLLGDVARDDLGGDVVDLVRLDHHPDLATCLHREHLLDAGLLARDLLDPLEPLHVVLERLAPRTRPAATPPPPPPPRPPFPASAAHPPPPPARPPLMPSAAWVRTASTVRT